MGMTERYVDSGDNC